MMAGLTNRLGMVDPSWDLQTEILSGGWDNGQYVRPLGKRQRATDWVVRFIASRACEYVRSHVQRSTTGGRSYNPSVFVSSAQVDCRQNRIQDVTVSVNGVNDYYIWLIPEFEYGGSFKQFNGAEAADHMAFAYLPV